MNLITLSSYRTVPGLGGFGQVYNTDIWIAPDGVSEIIENTGGEPACILIMKNGSKYDINMTGAKLAKMLKDYND